MTRLTDTRLDRPWFDLGDQLRTFAQRAQSNTQRGQHRTPGAAVDHAKADRVSHDPTPRAETPTTVAAGLPTSSAEPPPAASPPIYTKGPHYFCPPGLEGTALDPLRLAEVFMGLPDDQKGNFFNALCQYNPSLGSALNSTLRDIRGELVQRNWLTTMDTKQGSTFTADGLPPWLLSALSTPGAAPAPAAPAPSPSPGGSPATQAPPIYTKGPSYFCPPGLEGTELDPLRLAEVFMALPEEQRGNFFNALCQYNPSLGSALNATLRDIRGADVQKNWVTTMDTKQGSTFTADGLPPWLLAALS